MKTSSLLNCFRRLSKVRSSRPRGRRRRHGFVPVAAELLEQRAMLVGEGDAFDVSLEATLPSGNYTTQLVGQFDNVQGDDVAHFNATTGEFYVSTNNAGTFTTSVWAQFSIGGWSKHLVGNFGGDGLDDIASFNTNNNTWWVSINVGGVFQTTEWARFSPAPGWDAQVVGNFNGDGFDDIANFNTRNATWWTSLSNGTVFNTTEWARFSDGSGWDAQVVGDFDSDGNDDIANFNSRNATWWVSTSESFGGAPDENGFLTTEWARFSVGGWDAQIVGDFNDDGNDDIANFNSRNNTWWVSVGPGGIDYPAGQRMFATNLWGSLPAGNWTNHLAGEFDGDLYSGTVQRDIASFDSNTGQWHVGLSNGGEFEHNVWSDFFTNGGWDFQDFGDFNGDGDQRQIMNFNQSNNTLWQSFPVDFVQNNTAVPILDNTTVTSTIDITNPGTILDVNVLIDLTHTFLDDLEVFLLGPTGLRVRLFADIGGSNDDFFGIFDDSAAIGIGVFGDADPVDGRRYRPYAGLAQFIGTNPVGTWTLEIRDDAGADVGTLDRWGLSIVSN